MIKHFQTLNKWQRLWVVIAAVICLYAIRHSIDMAVRIHRVDYEVSAAFEKPECKSILKMSIGDLFNEGKEKPNTDLEGPCRKLFLYRLYHLNYAGNTSKGYIEHMNSPFELGNIILLVGVFCIMYFAPITLVLYAVGAALGWITKGPPTTTK